MCLSKIGNKITIKSEEISNKINSSTPVQFAQRKYSQLAKLADKLPTPLMTALHMIPIVNIFVCKLKEKGLDERLPELNISRNAEARCKLITAEVENVTKQKKIHEAKPDAASKNMTAQCNKQLRFLEEEGQKTQTLLETSKEALAAKNQNGEVEQIDKERHLYKSSFRVGLVVLAAAVAGIFALTIFTSAPVILGFSGLFLLGGSLGIHMAQCKGADWKNKGDIRLLLAKADAAPIEPEVN